MGILFINGKFQAIDESGNPLTGGKLYSYASGTTTPKDTYSDKACATPNANPVVLNSRGEAAVWMTTGDYKFILKTSADVTIWTADEIESDFELSIVTTKGDIIQGGNTAVAERLAIGSEFQVPMVNSSLKLAYASLELPVVLTNKTGIQVAANDVVVSDPDNDSAFDVTTTQGDTRPVLIVDDTTIDNNASGKLYKTGIHTIAVQGNVTRGNYLRISTTSRKAEDAGSKQVPGVFAIALTAYAGGGAGTVSALMVGGVSEAITPIGAVSPYAGITVPVGWLFCNGSAISRTTYINLYGTLTVSKGAFTVTIASPGVVTLTGHGLATGDCVELTTTGALPTGLSANTNYYVIYVGADTFRLATSYANAVADTDIDTSGTQSGVHTLRYCPYGISGASDFLLPDMRQRFPMGKAASGTGLTLGGTGGAIDHTHTGPSHNHQWYKKNADAVTDQSYNSGGSLVSVALGGAKTGGAFSILASFDGTGPSADWFTALAGTGASGLNNPPFQVVNYIIKY